MSTAVAPATRRRGLGFVPLVLLVYAATRVVDTVILWHASGTQVPTGMTGGQSGFWPFMAMWDGEWYGRIAEHGYPHDLPVGRDGLVAQNEWAFYPLFPLLARGLMALGLSFPVAGSLVSLACGFGAAVLIGLLLRERIGAPATYAVVLLFGLFPASIVLQVAYTEALAVLLLAAYLWALDRERWLLATGIALLTGLARPIAVPLGVVTLVAVLVRWRRRGRDPIDGRTWASMVAALVGCGVAGLIWPTIAWLGTGVRDAYAQTMSSWRAGHHIEALTPWWTNFRFFFGDTWAVIWLLVIAVIVLALPLGPWARRLGPVLRAWSLAYPAYLAVVLDPHTSAIRYVIPLFTVLPVVVGAGGTRPARPLPAGVPPHALLAIRTGIVAAIFLVLQVWWTHEIYVFTPPSDWPP